MFVEKLSKVRHPKYGMINWSVFRWKKNDLILDFNMYSAILNFHCYNFEAPKIKECF